MPWPGDQLLEGDSEEVVPLESEEPAVVGGAGDGRSKNHRSSLSDVGWGQLGNSRSLESIRVPR